MTTDFDTDRPDNSAESSSDAESLEELRERRAARVADQDIDEANADEDLELPGADLSHEELVINVLPKQHDEFTCMSCFLVHHRSQRVSTDPDLCSDCA